MKFKIEEDRYERAGDDLTIKAMVSTADKLWEEGDKHGAILLNFASILVETNVRLSEITSALHALAKKNG